MSAGARGREAQQPARRAEYMATTATERLVDKRYAEAAEIFGGLVTDQTRDTRLLRGYARALTGIGETPAVVKGIKLQLRALEEAKAKGVQMEDGNRGEKLEILVEMGVSFGRVGATEKSLSCYARVLQEDPDNPAVTFLRKIQDGEVGVTLDMARQANEAAHTDPERALLLREQHKVALLFYENRPQGS